MANRAASIIPALDEEPAIGRTLDRVPRDLYCAIIVADNGSRDRTAEIAREYGAAVVSEPERGYGAACLRAISALPDSVEAVVFMDADSSDDPAEAVLLLEPIYEGRADLVIGSRTLGEAEKGALEPHQCWETGWPPGSFSCFMATATPTWGRSVPSAQKRCTSCGWWRCPYRTGGAWASARFRGTGARVSRLARKSFGRHFD